MKTFFQTHRWKIIILLLAICALPILCSQLQTTQKEPEDVIVYVTRTGAKYHRASCRSLRYSKIPMTLKEAAKSYTPCRICDPPLLIEK